MERIDVKRFRTFSKKVGNKVKVAMYDGVTFSVRHVVPFVDMIQIVDTVSDSCFSEETGYIPEARDYVFRTVIFEKYTNLQLPKDNDERYEFIYSFEELFFFILGYISKEQLDAIQDAIDEKINHRIDMSISTAEHAVIDLNNSVKDLVGQLSSATKDITEDDIKSVVQAVAEQKINEVAMARAKMDAKKGKK